MNDGLVTLANMAHRAARIHELRLHLRRIPERLAEAHKALGTEQTLLDELQGPAQEWEQAIASKEATVKVALETIEKFEAHIRRVTTQKEFAAAKKQVDEARRLNDRLQNEILEFRMKQEEVSPKLQEQRERHGKVAEEYHTVEQQILAEKKALETELHAEEEQLRSEAAHMKGPVLAHYDRLVRGGRMPPIVPVIAGKCKGCNMALPPHYFNQLLAKNGSLFNCPHCGRIIYHQPPEAPAESAPAQDSATA